MAKVSPAAGWLTDGASLVLVGAYESLRGRHATRCPPEASENDPKGPVQSWRSERACSLSSRLVGGNGRRRDQLLSVMYRTASHRAHLSVWPEALPTDRCSSVSIHTCSKQSSSSSNPTPASYARLGRSVGRPCEPVELDGTQPASTALPRTATGSSPRVRIRAVEIEVTGPPGRGLGSRAEDPRGARRPSTAAASADP